MKKPEPFIEVFMSLIKWFLVVLLINNLIWGAVMYSFVAGTSAEISQTQDGISNIQEINNG